MDPDVVLGFNYSMQPWDWAKLEQRLPSCCF
jgi:hypothetical protein